MNKLFKILFLISIVGSIFAAEEDERLSIHMVENLKKIIDKNKTHELTLLLNNNAFNVNGFGLEFAIRTNIREIKGKSQYSGGSFRCTNLLLNSGLTPLIFAGIYAKPQIINLLLQAGANPNKGLIIEGETYYPLTIAYRGNFDDLDEKDALVEMTHEFINANTCKAQLEQAFNFVNETIELFDSELAQPLRALLEEALHQRRNQIICAQQQNPNNNDNNPPPYDYESNPPSYEEAMKT